MRIPSHWLIIGVGVSVLWLMRYLPPDASLTQIREKGVVTVCHPVSLPPFVNGTNEPEGLEADLVREVARALDVRIAWNVQRDWYRTLDPTAWGIRKGACDLLIGGVADTLASRNLLMLSEPHLETGWAFVGHSLPERRDDVGFWAPYMGLEQTRFDATDFLDERRYYPYFLEDLEEAKGLLEDETLTAVLTDERTAQWLAEETGLDTFAVDELEPFRFAIGLWKGDVTLRREVDKALASSGLD